MDRTILVSLDGHAGRFRLDEPADARLSRYLERAAARLYDDPDRAEVLGDLERSVGDRLAALPGPADRVVTTVDIDGVLEAIGAVETGHDPVADVRPAPGRRRRLRRVREGQQIAGVCTGLAAYAEIDVDWVRTVFVLGTLVTAGILGLVYIVLVLVLPVTPTREA
jgi:phage shock protein PspC (stress-responsive transcriptional regulator)